MKLLVGYGNTMRCDDGVGWQVADHLSSHYDAPDVDVMTVHQLLPEIAAFASQAEQVIFVDASIDGEPGTVRVCEVSPLDQLEDAHALTPSGIVYLCHSLYNASPTIHLVTVTGASFDLGETLSDEVLAAVPHVVAVIRQLLED